MRTVCFIVSVLGIAHLALGQATTPALETASTNPTSEPAPESDEKKWEFSLSATVNFVPHQTTYVQPTLTADHDWIHLEARYNYEDIDTGSLWVGYNFTVGKELTLAITPMFGGVFGHTNGVAPGYEATLSWWKIELYSEGEYVIDTGDSSDSFFYTWSQLSIAPVEWLSVGIAIQRTKAYQTDFDIQRGFLVGFTYKNLNFTTFVLNPDNEPIVQLQFSISF